jgi:TP901 family phage tail tape measure protein
MADLSKTVEIIFGGRNDLTKTLSGLEREFGRLDDVVQSVAAPLAGVADSILKVDAALLALAIGGMALAVRESGKFGGQFAEITTLIGDVGQPIDKFRADILNYATTSTKSLDQINAAIYASISAGVDYKDALAFVAQAEKLAVAGVADLGATTTALVSTLNAYGASTAEATRYSDLLFTTVALGQTKVEALATQLSKVTGLAANSGVPFATLSAAVAALTYQGVPTEQALTAIKAALSNIIKPSKDAEETAQALGIQFSASALKTKGFEGILWDAWKATRGNTEQMAQLFGSVEALNSVVMLAADKTGKFKEALAAMGTATGATQAAYDKMANQFDAINQRLANSFNVTLVEIGDRLMPRYGEIAGALGDLMKGIRVGVDSGAFDPLFQYLDSVGSAIAQQLAGIAKAFPEAMKMIDFQGLVDALRQLGAAFGEYLGGLDLTAPKDLAAVIQFLIDGVTGLVRITTGMVEAFRPFVQQIADFVVGMAQADKETQETMGAVLAFAKAIQTAGLAFVGVILAAEEFQVSIAGAFNVVAGSAQVLFNVVQMVIGGVKLMLITLFQGFVDFIDFISMGMIPGLKDVSKTFDQQISGSIKDLGGDFEDMKRGLGKVVDGFSDVADSAGKGTQGAEKLRDRLKDIGETTVEPKIVPRLDEPATEKAARAAATKVAEVLPPEKKIEVKPKVDQEALARLKEQSAIVQKTIEWSAKIRIAEVEAGVKALAAAFSNLDARVASTGTTLTDMMKGLGDENLSWAQSSMIENMMREEAKHRAEAMKQSQKLTEQQILLNELRIKAMEDGGAEIRVSADGLKPHLEMILWEVLEAVQIRASQNQAEFLLGWKS